MLVTGKGGFCPLGTRGEVCGPAAAPGMQVPETCWVPKGAGGGSPGGRSRKGPGKKMGARLAKRPGSLVFSASRSWASAGPGQAAPGACGHGAKFGFCFFTEKLKHSTENETAPGNGRSGPAAVTQEVRAMERRPRSRPRGSVLSPRAASQAVGLDSGPRPPPGCARCPLPRASPCRRLKGCVSLSSSLSSQPGVSNGAEENTDQPHLGPAQPAGE